jgi:hypothetical protein
MDEYTSKYKERKKERKSNNYILITVITLNHNSSLCIWSAAPDTIWSRQGGAKFPARCRMLFFRHPYMLLSNL